MDSSPEIDDSFLSLLQRPVWKFRKEGLDLLQKEILNDSDPLASEKLLKMMEESGIKMKKLLLDPNKFIAKEARICLDLFLPRLGSDSLRSLIIQTFETIMTTKPAPTLEINSQIIKHYARHFEKEIINQLIRSELEPSKLQY